MNVMDVRESVVLTALAGLAFAIFACAAFAVVRRLRAVFAARCRFVGFWILLVGIGLTVRVCATKPAAGIAAAPPMSLPDAPSAVQDGGASVTNLRITACAVTTNGIDLALAWPSSLFPDGACLDLFAKVGALEGDWIWLDCLTVASAATNASFSVRYADLTAATNAPSAAFFRVGDRATSASTMRDQDGDGLPDVYELHNGTNPYVADFESAPKLTVGPDGDFSTISAAFAASTNYSVIALSAHPESSDGMIVMPSHPVMVTGPEDGYAVLHSSANIAAFLMDAGQGDETLFRNLYVVLEARDGFQSAFWVGGNLPWSGAGASPAFENVRVRALYPNVLHYGWHYYCDNGGFSSLSNCVMNAAGSSSAVGIYAYDGPGVGMSDCVFVNFPTDGGSCATWIRSGTNIVAETVSGSANRSWAGCPLDVLYGNDDDSDADGLSDYGEVHAYDTDPWLSDSDGDGLSDSEEISAGTDPCDLYSFYRRVTVVTTAADNLAEVTNYVAWGTSREGWETNGISAWQTLPSTNVYEVMSASGPMYVKAYRDLNRNGEYDADTDIILVEQVPPLDAVTSFTFRFGDVDGDGVADDVERLDGSDPYDGKSFRLRAVVTCADTDRSVPVTNHLGVAGEFHDADVAFAESGTLTVDAIVTNGACVVNCWRDFNGNGEYDDGVDVLCSRTLTKADNGKTVLMSVGDADGDGQSDSSELAHGTDPHDAKIYCFNLAFVEDGVFSTTNRLSAEVLFGADVLVGPVVMSNRSWECDLGHLTASNRETIVRISFPIMLRMDGLACLWQIQTVGYMA